MYGGAEPEFQSSLSKTKAVFQAAGHTVEIDIHSGCSIITKARNEIVKRFLDSGFDKLLFIDSDMVWDAIDAFQVVSSSHDVCAIPYCVKNDTYKMNCIENGEKDGIFLGANAVGTGFLCLSRQALLKMWHLSPKYFEQGEEYRTIFDFEVREERYYGEDYNFCRRWIVHGGKIWLYPARIGHIGKKIYWTAP